jgi:hypothetical protein
MAHIEAFRFRMNRLTEVNAKSAEFLVSAIANNVTIIYTTLISLHHHESMVYSHYVSEE